jgi:hypothetical protein
VDAGAVNVNVVLPVPTRGQAKVTTPGTIEAPTAEQESYAPPEPVTVTCPPCTKTGVSDSASRTGISNAWSLSDGPRMLVSTGRKDPVPAGRPGGHPTSDVCGGRLMPPAREC